MKLVNQEGEHFDCHTIFSFKSIEVKNIKSQLLEF